MRAAGWLVLVAGCSSANPAFDPPGDGDTEGVLDGGLGSSGDALDTDTADPGMTTDATGDGTPAIPGTCDALETDFVVQFEIRHVTDGLRVRTCGAVTKLTNCSITNTVETGWVLAGCSREGDQVDLAALELTISPPPQQGIGTTFEGDVVFASAPDAAGCDFEWGTIEQTMVSDGSTRLVWAGSNVLDPGTEYPITSHPKGSTAGCECGNTVTECNENYGPQMVELCAEGFFACGLYGQMDDDAIVMLPNELQYGVLVVRAWEHEEAGRPGDYSHVVRLLTPIEPG
jgi:hypothetical protein